MAIQPVAALTRKVGPQPAWAWLVEAGGGIYLLRRHNARTAAGATGSNAGVPSGAGSAGFGDGAGSAGGGGGADPLLPDTPQSSTAPVTWDPTQTPGGDTAPPPASATTTTGGGPPAKPPRTGARTRTTPAEKAAAHTVAAAVAAAAGSVLHPGHRSTKAKAAGTRTRPGPELISEHGRGQMGTRLRGTPKSVRGSSPRKMTPGGEKPVARQRSVSSAKLATTHTAAVAGRTEAAGAHRLPAALSAPVTHSSRIASTAHESTPRVVGRVQPVALPPAPTQRRVTSAAPVHIVTPRPHRPGRPD